MSRLDSLFAARAAEKRKVLVAYLCVGDPSVDESFALARAAVLAGADVLELGVPFSDPTADGPAIARASQRAIAAGSGFAAATRVAKGLHDDPATRATPIVLFGYYNPIFVRGEARAVAEAADAGVDALLVVDLPLDEAAPLRDEAKKRGLAVVPLLTPTSSPERVAGVKSASAKWPLGFVYYVSVTGVTGSAAVRADEAGAAAASLRAALGLPVVVGFGIDSGDKARAAAANVDGAVVGTALVKRIEDGATAEARARGVTELVAALRAGLDS